MVSLRQLDAMLSFMERHKDLALGKCARTKEGRSMAKRLWAQCANILNNVSNGQTKSAEHWRFFYNEYKSKIIRKIRKVKIELRAAGGDPDFNTIHSILTPLQQRLYFDILSKDAEGPLDAVRSDSGNEDPLTCEANSTQIKIEIQSSGDSDMGSPSGSDHAPKQQSTSQDMMIAQEPQMNEAALTKNEEVNECDLYGQLLAQKLKTLDAEDRLVVMNGIDNYVFKYLMNVKKKNLSMKS